MRNTVLNALPQLTENKITCKKTSVAQPAGQGAEKLGCESPKHLWAFLPPSCLNDVLMVKLNYLWEKIGGSLVLCRKTVKTRCHFCGA